MTNIIYDNNIDKSFTLGVSHRDKYGTEIPLEWRPISENNILLSVSNENIVNSVIAKSQALVIDFSLDHSLDKINYLAYERNSSSDFLFIVLRNIDQIESVSNKKDIADLLIYGHLYNIHCIVITDNIITIDSMIINQCDLQVFYDSTIVHAEEFYGICQSFLQDKHVGVAKTLLTGNSLIPIAELFI